MTKGRRVFFGALVVVIFGGIAVMVPPRPAPEPVYEGKTLTKWLQNYKVAGNPGVEEFEAFRQADVAIARMGTNAYPTLLRELQAHEFPLKPQLVALAQKQHFISVRYTPALDRFNQARTAFGRLGRTIVLDSTGSKDLWPRGPRISPQHAEQLVPGLISMLEHGMECRSRQAGAIFLGRIGPGSAAAVPALLRAASNTQPCNLGAVAVLALGEIGADPARVVPVLANALRSGDSTLRACAVQSLCQMPADPKSADVVVPALIAAFVSSPGGNQQVPATLARYGPAAKSAVPQLLEFLKAVPPGQEYQIPPVVAAIRQIDPETAAAHKGELGFK